jgi:hypothetical protein
MDLRIKRNRAREVSRRRLNANSSSEFRFEYFDYDPIGSIRTRNYKRYFKKNPGLARHEIGTGQKEHELFKSDGT